MEGNWPGLAQSRFWLLCNQILIENERKLAWAGSELILIDLQSNSDWKSHTHTLTHTDAPPQRHTHTHLHTNTHTWTHGQTQTNMFASNIWFLYGFPRFPGLLCFKHLIFTWFLRFPKFFQTMVGNECGYGYHSLKKLGKPGKPGKIICLKHSGPGNHGKPGKNHVFEA